MPDKNYNKARIALGSNRRLLRKARPFRISNRTQFWGQYPEMGQAVDSVANVYGINPGMLRSRLDREGPVDEEIKLHNMYFDSDPTLVRNGKNLFNASVPAGYGPKRFGLDDVGTMINEGKVKLKGENYSTGDFTNEKGRQTLAASGDTFADNVGLMAATLRYFKDVAAQRHPDLSDYELNRYASGYYNRGPYGDSDEFIRTHPNWYRYNYK